MLMLSASAQAQGYEQKTESQVQAQSDESKPAAGSHGAATIEQHEEGVIEPNASDSALEDQHGLDQADELARSDTADDLAMPEDLDANDPDRVAQAETPQADAPDADQLPQGLQDQDQRTDAGSNNGSDLNANRNDLEPIPAPNNRQ